MSVATAADLDAALSLLTWRLERYFANTRAERLPPIVNGKG
jgi:hypothetical protein